MLFSILTQKTISRPCPIFAYSSQFSSQCASFLVLFFDPSYWPHCAPSPHNHKEAWKALNITEFRRWEVLSFDDGGTWWQMESEEGWGVFTVTVRVLRSSYNHICCHEHSGRPQPGSKPAFRHGLPLARPGLLPHTSRSSILRRSLAWFVSFCWSISDCLATGCWWSSALCDQGPCRTPMGAASSWAPLIVLSLDPIRPSRGGYESCHTICWPELRLPPSRCFIMSCSASFFLSRRSFCSSGSVGKRW